MLRQRIICLALRITVTYAGSLFTKECFIVRRPKKQVCFTKINTISLFTTSLIVLSNSHIKGWLMSIKFNIEWIIIKNLVHLLPNRYRPLSFRWNLCSCSKIAHFSLHCIKRICRYPLFVCLTISKWTPYSGSHSRTLYKEL